MITQIVYLVIAIVVLTFGLTFVCIRGAQIEHRINVLEKELDILKEESTLLSQKCNYLLGKIDLI